MDGNQTRNYSRRSGLAEIADIRVKPCSVVLCADEVESYLGRKRKLEPLFEIQKVFVKCEPDSEVLPPEFVNVFQDFEPSAQRLFIDESNSGCKRLHQIKQEFEDEVSITNETQIVKQESVPIVLQESIPNIGTESDVTMLSPITIEQEYVSNSDIDSVDLEVNGDLLFESTDTTEPINEEDGTIVVQPVSNSLGSHSIMCDPPLLSLSVESKCLEMTRCVINEDMLPSSSSQDDTCCLPETSSSDDDEDDMDCTYDVQPRLQQDKADSTMAVPGHILRQKLLISFRLCTRNTNGVYTIPFSLKCLKVSVTFQQISEVLQNQDFCKKLFSSKDSIYYCIFCFKTYKNPSSFYKHLTIVHEVEFYCCSCQTRCSSLHSHIISSNHKFSLSNDILNFWTLQSIYNYVGSKFRQCLLCKVDFSSVEKLFYHVRVTHRVCRVCGASFESFLDLLAHNDKHSSGKIRYFKCNSCDLKLYDNLEHMKKHDVKNISCSADISQEIVLFPPMKVEFRSRCPYCPLSFVKSSALFAHSLGHIVKNCISCSKNFIVSEFLSNKLHLVTKCITCSVIDAENLESISLVTSIAHFSNLVSDSIKNLSKGSITEFYINVSKKPDEFKPLNHCNIQLGKLENVKLKFSTSDIEFNLSRGRVSERARKPSACFNCFFCQDMLHAEDFYEHFDDCVLLSINCEICQWSGDSLLELQTHLSENHDYGISSTDNFKSLLGECLYLKCYEIVEQPLSCLLCNDQFNDISNLLNHLKNMHSICRFCGIVFPNVVEHFEHHETLCHDFYQCKFCDVMSNSICLANEHSLKHYSAKLTKKTLHQIFLKKCKDVTKNYYYNCPCCPGCFQEEIHIRDHLKVHTTWKCITCDLTYIAPYNEYDEVNSKCVKCQNNLLSVSDTDTSIDLSLKFNNGSCAPIVSALFLNKTAGEPDSYKIISTFHMSSIRVAYNALKKSVSFDSLYHLYRCKYCEKHFELGIANLCFHFVHKHEMKLACQSCSLSPLPRVVSDMTNHLIHVHESRPVFVDKLILYVTHILQDRYVTVDHVKCFEFARTCLFCKQSFAHFSTLYDHIIIDHHYCNPCGIQFGSNKELTTHKELHSRKKIFVYKCLLCGIKFRTIDAVNSHFKQHRCEFSKEVLNSRRYDTVVSLLKPNKITGSSRKPSILQRKTVVKLTFDCPYCISEFDVESVLCQHILKNHKVIKCVTCSKDFAFSVERQEWMHAPLMESCYRCILYNTQ